MYKCHVLQSDINKYRLSQLAKLDKLCINYVSTRLFQRSTHDLVEDKNEIFLNNLHINLSAYYAV